MLRKAKTKPTDLSLPPNTVPEGGIAIQRLPIHLPGFTTVIKFEPRYAFALYKAKWKFRDPKAPVHDTEDSVRILPNYPLGISWKEVWLVFEDEAEAMDMERERLAAYFGTHPNGELLFDVVYPGDAFDRAFASALKPTMVAESIEHANPAVAELASLAGIGEGLAEKLVARGIRSVRELALTPEDDLAKIIGKTRAPKAIAEAEARFDKSPAEA